MSGENSSKAGSDGERRKYLRRHLLRKAKLQCGRFEFDCWVYNMSLDGADVRLDLPLAADCGVVLVIKGIGPISGRVVWNDANLIGVEFITGEDKIRKLLGTDADRFAQPATSQADG